jgi:hypothetical protein
VLAAPQLHLEMRWAAVERGWGWQAAAAAATQVEHAAALAARQVVGRPRPSCSCGW